MERDPSWVAHHRLSGGAHGSIRAQALFVTQKTVENHLGHVYSKLGIVSRSELGAALANSGGSRL